MQNNDQARRAARECWIDYLSHLTEEYTTLVDPQKTGMEIPIGKIAGFHRLTTNSAEGSGVAHKETRLTVMNSW